MAAFGQDALIGLVEDTRRQAYVDKASQALKNNFAAWREASPKHNALVDAMLGAPMHIIATIRSKTAWEVVKDERTGKTRPVKIGLAPVQRDGLEYEFTAVLELSVDGHIATATKDRTSLFDGSYFTPGIDTGETLKSWLNGTTPDDGNGQGEPVTRKPEPFPAQKETDIPAKRSSTVVDLFNSLRKLGLGSKIPEYEVYLAGKYGHGVRDLTQEQLDEQHYNLQRCKDDKQLFQKFTNYLDGLKKAA
ncbi:AAA family ATPase [Desulfonatronovibrio magnus]|uniref:AAA family ATPase n=1 Tax=Desulfonatronovibrio magnus TaxID=698827 RepID=UPI0006991675|nr:AAA family ATPase [Desulfonatronovibrio magnus]